MTGLRDLPDPVPLADAVRDEHVDRRRAGHLADVGARGERPLVAGHHDRADAIVAVELLERGAQRVHDRAVERVELLRAIEADQRRALLRLALDEDELLVVHGRPSACTRLPRCCMFVSMLTGPRTPVSTTGHAPPRPRQLHAAGSAEPMCRRQTHRTARRTHPPVAGLQSTELGEARLPLLMEGGDRLPRLVGAGVDRQPVAGVLDRLRPDEVAPPVELRLGVTHRLGQLPREVVGQVAPRWRPARRASRRATPGPTRAPVAGGIGSQSITISRARRSPTMSGSHWVAPPAGTDPCSGPTCRMYASSTSTDRSQAIWSSLPPPTQIPLMRAIVGLPMWRRRSCMSMNAPIQRQYWPLVAPMAACSSRSAPVQKDRSPAPVTTTTATPSSQDACSNARAISRSVGKSRAFRTSGRLMVTVATPRRASRS